MCMYIYIYGHVLDAVSESQGWRLNIADGLQLSGKTTALAKNDYSSSSNIVVSTSKGQQRMRRTMESRQKNSDLSVLLSFLFVPV